ncbi:MAG TPA: glycosyltransferase [Anaerolineaceae bacterium]|nr:glycosyltransferase [Anaerolineaceae bacterium]
MNIAMISYHTCPLATLGGKDTGGMNVYVREVTHYLGRRGVHVDVFTRSQDEHVPHVLHDLGYGNRVVHIPAGPEVPLPKPELVNYLPQFVEGIRKFSTEKRIKYDLIYSHYWLSGIAADSLKKSWGIPVVHMFHTLGLMKNRIAQSPEELEGEYRVNGERQVLQMADRIIAPTLAEEAQLYFLYHADVSKITIIPPGVDTDHFYPIPPDEAREAIHLPVNERMLLFVGRIEPLKGLDTLLRAIAHMRETGVYSQVPHYLAVVGGDPSATGENLSSEMARLQTLCSELNLNDMVLFLGKRDQASLPYYYSAADVLIMPSHYESFGMVALEAMACGTPVVASRVGGLAFLVADGKTGFVFPDNDFINLSEKLTLLLTNPGLRDRLGQQAADYARQYAWPNIVNRLLNTFTEVLCNQ